MLTDVSLYSLNVVGGSRKALRRFVQAFVQYIFDFVIAVATVDFDEPRPDDVPAALARWIQRE